MSLLLMLTVNFMTLRVLRSYTRKQNVRYANSNVVKARVERRGMIILVSTHHLTKKLWNIKIISLRRQCHWRFFLLGCQVWLWMHTVSNMLINWKIYSGSLIPWWVTELLRKNISFNSRSAKEQTVLHFYMDSVFIQIVQWIPSYIWYLIEGIVTISKSKFWKWTCLISRAGEEQSLNQRYRREIQRWENPQ